MVEGLVVRGSVFDSKQLLAFSYFISYHLSLYCVNVFILWQCLYIVSMSLYCDNVFIL